MNKAEIHLIFFLLYLLFIIINIVPTLILSKVNLLRYYHHLDQLVIDFILILPLFVFKNETFLNYFYNSSNKIHLCKSSL
jgi:hypothetical protein